MKIPGLRHSAEQVGGIVFFGRMLDKIRLHAQGKLPPDYKHGTGTDGRVCRFLHVEYPSVVERVLAGATDEEVLEWCFARGRRPNDEEIFIFNAFLSKRGWRDKAAGNLANRIKQSALEAAPIMTMFDYLDFDEGRDPVTPKAWEL